MPRDARRRGRGRPVLRHHRLRALRRRRLRRRVLGPHRRRRGTGRAAPRGHRPLDRAGVGGQPRLADLLLVVLWTAFSEAFASITLTLFVPLTLAAFGIVLRGLELRVPQGGVPHPRPTQLRRRVRARRRCSCRTAWARSPARSRRAGSRRAARPATRGRAGSTRRRSSVACSPSRSCAYLVGGLPHLGRQAARRRRHGRVLPTPRDRRRRSSRASSRSSASSCSTPTRPYLFDGLTSRALPLVIVSGLCGIGSLVLLLRDADHGARAALGRRGGVGRGRLGRRPVALHPADEPRRCRRPRRRHGTLQTVLVVFVLAAVIILPSLRAALRARPEEPAARRRRRLDTLGSYVNGR